MIHDNDDKKIKIYQSARKLFLHYGVQKTTISDIAKEADIGKGTIYSYFDSKEDILVYIGCLYFMDSINNLKRRLKKLNDPVKKLREIVLLKPVEVYKFIHTYKHGFDILLYIRKAEGEIGKFSEHFKTYCDLFSDTVDELIETKNYHVDDKEKFIEHYKFMTQAFMPPYSGIDSEESLKLHINLYVDMMLKSIQSA